MTGTATQTRVALYARVSTHNGQDPETQLQPLRQMAEQRDWKIVGEYVDHGVSGSKEDRPSLNKMMTRVRRGGVDAVAVWKFDRFARSVSHLLTALEEFKLHGVDFISITESVDSSTAMGKMIFVVVAAMAAFELDLARERIKAGVHRAQSEGKHCGRPRRQIDLRAAKELLGLGHSMRQVSQMLTIPRSTLRRKFGEPVQGGPKVPEIDLPNNGGEKRATTPGH
jgi:DNA invertase Pin-like site-specific DNA recombinase